MAVPWKSWNVSWKGWKAAVTMGEMLDAIKKGNGKLAKSTVLKGIATAAGANLYTGVSTIQKACNGNGVLPPDDKASIMMNWESREHEVLAYISDLIKDVDYAAIKLGVAKAESYDKGLLCKAVRFQFATFFDNSAGIDVDNHIPDIYQKLLENPKTIPVIGGALYSGDAAHDYSKCKRCQIEVFGSLQYEMELQNTGKISWVNRAMVFEGKNAKVRSSPERVQIPETRPNGIVKLQFTLFGRGVEGTTNMCWKMVDANGNDCFPKEPDKFHMEISTTFTPKE